MALAWILAVQTAASPAALTATVPIDFDLAKVRPGDGEADGRLGCRGGDPAEIVVCGRRRGGNYPMEEMARRYAFEPIVAETGIGGGSTARAYVESVAMPDGQVSKRAMVGIKLPF
ncbi:MAG TPA: hypothetical protein VF631_08435 [Allosphingosinicella sp.]|uniref:hypothetical protein n=1 Tax=Allosphingosinicella sp. TaxID=2823234 RepID=UPI002F281854